MLTPEQINENYTRLRELINSEFPASRSYGLNKMYDDLEDQICLSPASSYEYFHNAFPGGYVDHILRVYDFALLTYRMWNHVGVITDNFTLEELKFAALHHDLGKIGLPYSPHYLPNGNDYTLKRGQMYEPNQKTQWMAIHDRTIFLLQNYGIQYSVVEMLGIKLTDGLYDESNKQYLVTYDLKNKLKTNLGTILHHSDMMAARFEFERWAKYTGKFNFEVK